MNKKQVDEEFHRIVEILRSQGDLDCIEDLIPMSAKFRFIKSWEMNE